MGSFIEMNDTLQIMPKQGFPSDILNFSKHIKEPIKLNTVVGKEFTSIKPRARIYHLAPTRVFLVENVEGKWLFWGKIVILEQRIHSKQGQPENWFTSGKFKIVDLYEPQYQKEFTIRESPHDKSYF